MPELCIKWALTGTDSSVFLQLKKDDQCLYATHPVTPPFYCAICEKFVPFTLQNPFFFPLNLMLFDRSVARIYFILCLNGDIHNPL